MEWDEALQKFGDDVNLADPVLDQAFASARDVFTQLGVSGITARDAQVSLTVLSLYLNAPEPTRLVIAAYLGTMLEKGKE